MTTKQIVAVILFIVAGALFAVSAAEPVRPRLVSIGLAFAAAGLAAQAWSLCRRPGRARPGAAPAARQA